MKTDINARIKINNFIQNIQKSFIKNGDEMFFCCTAKKSSSELFMAATGEEEILADVLVNAAINNEIFRGELLRSYNILFNMGYLKNNLS
jgi:hypothetical protein